MYKVQTVHIHMWTAFCAYIRVFGDTYKNAWGQSTFHTCTSLSRLPRETTCKIAIMKKRKETHLAAIAMVLAAGLLLVAVPPLAATAGLYGVQAFLQTATASTMLTIAVIN